MRKNRPCGAGCAKAAEAADPIDRLSTEMAESRNFGAPAAAWGNFPPCGGDYRIHRRKASSKRPTSMGFAM